MAEILGYSVDEMLGKSIISSSAVHNDRAYLEEKLLQIKSGSNEHFELDIPEKRLRHLPIHGCRHRPVSMKKENSSMACLWFQI